MTTLREAAQQALEAMKGELPGWRTPAQERAITALRDALAQQAQEPVAWRHWLLVDGERFPQLTLVPRTDIDEPLYTRPPRRREWRSLTDDEISALFSSSLRSDYKPYSFARAIEAKLKEKNHD